MNSPIPNHYDPENARQLVEQAADAYNAAASRQCSTASGASRYCADSADPNGGCLSTLRRNATEDGPTAATIIESAATDTRVVISELTTPNSALPTDLVIAFRGTADLRNWLTDLDCEKVPLLWSAGKVHRGFNLALESVAEELDAALDPDDPRPLWVTGHSLGGALAMLFALRTKLRRGRDVAGVYTFGQPRVGDIRFSLGYDTILKARTHRVVHADDVVPRVPWLLGAFRHCGTEVFYSPLPTQHSPLINPPWWQKMPGDIFGAWSEWQHSGRIAPLNDHHVSKYQALFSNSVAASRQRAANGGCLPTAATEITSNCETH